jgi:hypothetical protein
VAGLGDVAVGPLGLVDAAGLVEHDALVQQRLDGFVGMVGVDRLLEGRHRVVHTALVDQEAAEIERRFRRGLCVTGGHRGGEQVFSLCCFAACGEEVAQVECGRTCCQGIVRGERGFIGLPCASQVTSLL